MNKRLWCVFAGFCGFAMLALCAIPSGAQASEVKEKPPMYSYIANWQIPRAQWGDAEKVNATRKAILDKALADGTIVGFGDDENLVHQPDGETHDNWWAAMSMAGLIKVLDQFAAASNPASNALLAGATKHWDAIFVSRYYNWKPGSWKGGYVHVGIYKLKPDAPDDAVETLSKNMVVPMMEKLLADGTIQEYEVDTQAIHTSAPSTFELVYVCPNPEGLDKVNAAIAETMKSSPMSGPAFTSMVDSNAHRDELLKGNGTYK